MMNEAPLPLLPLFSLYRAVTCQDLDKQHRRAHAGAIRSRLDAGPIRHVLAENRSPERAHHQAGRQQATTSVFDVMVSVVLLMCVGDPVTGTGISCISVSCIGSVQGQSSSSKLKGSAPA